MNSEMNPESPNSGKPFLHWVTLLIIFTAFVSVVIS